MKKMLRRLIGAALACGMTMSLLAGSAAMVSADSTKVVSLGADLNDSQKNSILKYFGVKSGQVQIIEVTNQDERNHLASYVPLEQIGNRTISCAYVQPTTSGGIQVKTANLTYVTSNMIAAALSTSGVKNCNVIAAAPFAVSGTGALTGCIMAYEAATGEQLSTAKKDTAAKEMITTSEVAQNVGQNQATEIVNKIKVDVVQQQVDSFDIEAIDRIVEAAVEKALSEREEVGFEAVSVTAEDMEILKDLATTFAEQDYDYDDMAETLERVEENVIGADIGSLSDVNFDDEGEIAEVAKLEEDNILLSTDDFALGDDVVIDATNEEALADIPLQTEEDNDEDFDFAILTADEGALETEEEGLNEFDGEDGFFGDDFFTMGEEDGEDYEVFDPAEYGEAELMDEEEYEETDEVDLMEGLDLDETGLADEVGLEEADTSEEAADSLSAVFDGFDAYAVRFFVEGSAAPSSGTVTIADADGNVAQSIDLSSCAAVGMSSSELEKTGWGSGTTVYAPVNSGLYYEDTFSVSVDGTFVDRSSGAEITVSGSDSLSYKDALIVPDYTGRCFGTDSMQDLTLFFPEEASYAIVSSSKESVAAAYDSEIYPMDDTSIGYVTISCGNSGATKITVEFFSESGDSVATSSIKIGVSGSGGARAE